MSEKIELREKISAVDTNVRELWDAMDEEQQKALAQEFYILNRYISNVKHPSSAIQEHFVIAVNEFYNKNWFTMQKHPKLAWLSLCMCSYDKKTTFYHEWISKQPKSLKKSSSKKINFLSELYPSKKMDEISMLADLVTDKELKALAIEHGYDSATISKKLK